jgi:isopentenyldiphosphate isomerase
MSTTVTSDTVSSSTASISSSASTSSSVLTEKTEEYFDILDEEGNKTGIARPRSEVHSLGLLHKAVHTWLLCPTTGEIVLQKRASNKDSWPDRWDISSAGHLSSGDESLTAAQRELHEELGIDLPYDRFLFQFTHFERLDSIQKGKPFRNHEFNDVYIVLVTPEERSQLNTDHVLYRTDDETLLPFPPSSSSSSASASSTTGSTDKSVEENNRSGNEPLQWRLQTSEVSAVCWKHWKEVELMYRNNDDTIVPTTDLDNSYGQLFQRFHELSRG